MTSARPRGCSRRPWRTSRRRAQPPVPSGTSCSAGTAGCRPTRLARPVTPGCAGLWPGSSARRSGLAASRGCRLMQLPGGVSAVSHLWWVLPALLRSDDLALHGRQQLERAAGRGARGSRRRTVGCPLAADPRRRADPSADAPASGAPAALSPAAPGSAATTRPSGRPDAGPSPARRPSMAPWPGTCSTSATGTTAPGSSSAAHQEIRPARTTSISTKPGPDASSSRCGTTGTRSPPPARS